MQIQLKDNTVYFEGMITLKELKPKQIDKKIATFKDNIQKIDINQITDLDTAGAYFILKIANSLGISKDQIVSNNHRNNKMIELVSQNYPSKTDSGLNHKSNVVFNSIYTLGKSTNSLLSEIKTSIGFLGAVFLGYLVLLRRPYKAFFFDSSKHSL